MRDEIIGKEQEESLQELGVKMTCFGTPHTAIMQTRSGASAAVLSTDLSGSACPRVDRAGSCSSRCRPGLHLVGQSHSHWGEWEGTQEYLMS